MLGLDPQPREVALVEAGHESRSHPHLDVRAVDPAHPEQQAAGLRRCQGLARRPPEAGGEPADEQQRLRRMDLAAVGVHREADAQPGDAVEERAPRRHVEELRGELAPRCDTCPVEVRQAVAAMSRAGDGVQPRERAVGAREVRRIHDQPVGELQQLGERRRVERRRLGPPEEYREVGEEERDHRAHEAAVRVAAGANEDLLVAHLLRAVGGREVIVHLEVRRLGARDPRRRRWPARDVASPARRSSTPRDARGSRASRTRRG